MNWGIEKTMETDLLVGTLRGLLEGSISYRPPVRRMRGHQRGPGPRFGLPHGVHQLYRRGSTALDLKPHIIIW